MSTAPARVDANSVAYFATPKKLQVARSRTVQRRDSRDFDRPVSDQSAADGLRNSRGGEDELALTAAPFLRIPSVARRALPVGHSAGGFGRVTPAGAVGAPAFAAGNAGFDVARSRDTTRSVMSRFLSADTITDCPGSFAMIIE